MEKAETLYTTDRNEWRAWLAANFDTASEIWLVYPKKASGKPRILYNDAVEEALCFGWIDSTVKRLDDLHTMQRFTPRKPRSTFSQPNKERLQWLLAQGMLHPSVEPTVREVLAEPFVFPEDILARVRADEAAWAFYQTLSAPYRRIRIAYVAQARKRPEEFERRLQSFVEKCQAGKMIKGFGGIEKYY